MTDLARKWLLWEGETGLIPSRHLPQLTGRHPHLMKGGSAVHFLKTTAFAARNEDGGFQLYKLIPGNGLNKPFGILWSFHKEFAVRGKLDRSIKVLEAEEAAMPQFFGHPLPSSVKLYNLAGLTGAVRTVDPWQGPPPAGTAYYEINYEYRYSEPDWLKMQIFMGICGQARVSRCIRGLGKRLIGDDTKGGLFTAMAHQLDQPIETLRRWLFVGAPLVRDDIVGDDPVDWDFRRASKTMLEQRSVLMLQQFEYLWEPHERWTEDQKKGFASYAAQMARVRFD